MLSVKGCCAMMNLGLISELPIVEDKFIYELYGINWYNI